MRFISLSLLAGAAALTGCASIVNGQNQSVSVEAVNDSGPVIGANCTLNNNKGTWFVTTPGSATVQRSYEDMSVKCLKEPMEPGLTSVKSSTKAMAFGNIIFGGVIGAGVDVATGAAYDYPILIAVTMGKMSGLPAAAPVATTTPPAAAPAASAPVASANSSASATAPVPATPAAPAPADAPASAVVVSR